MRSRAGRIAVVVGTVAVIVVLFAVLRRSEDGESTAGTAATTTAADTTTTASTPTATAPTTTAAPEPTRIRVTLRGGNVVGGVRTERVSQGDRVVLVVRADVSDHVHLHGYDRVADVAPGAPAQLAIRATIPGRFEVELEDRKLRILELEVRP